MRRTLWFTAALATVAFLLIAPQLRADRLDVARIFIEFNDTDQDVGAHVFFDGPAWKAMKIFDPNGTKIMDIVATGSVGTIGVSEMFFEGEEPSLDELPLEEFFARFPEGNYRFDGLTVEGKPLRGTGRFSHEIPDGPVIVAPAPGAVVDPNNAVISWQSVTTPAGIVIVGYEIIVDGSSIKVPATATSVTVPPESLEPGTHEFEVLAIEESGNQTISSSLFVTE